MKEEKIRKSNFELMRIVSMFMIVIGHLIVHGYLLENTTGIVHLILQFLLFIVIVHVNSFVLLSGYFQSKSNMRISKVLQLNNSMWFYKVVFLIIFVILKIYSLPIVNTIKTILPINYGDYWFMSDYLILYLISPILNVIISGVTKEKYRKIIITLFIILCIFSPFTNEVLYNNNRGYSLGNFILLYFIGGYFRNYDIDKNIIMNKLTINCKRLIYLFGFTFIALINFSICKLGENLSILSSIPKEIGETIVNASIAYDNPLIVIQTIFFFLFFKTLKVKSKFVNLCASGVFGVYLIHENPLLSNRIYQFFKLHFINKYDISLVYKIFIYAVIIFIISDILEICRQFIFKLIYNMRISCKFRKKYRNYINSLGININW